MLKNRPQTIPPELLKILCEMVSLATNLLLLMETSRRRPSDKELYI